MSPYEGSTYTLTPGSKPFRLWWAPWWTCWSCPAPVRGTWACPWTGGCPGSSHWTPARGAPSWFTAPPPAPPASERGGGPNAAVMEARADPAGAAPACAASGNDGKKFQLWHVKGGQRHRSTCTVSPFTVRNSGAEALWSCTDQPRRWGGCAGVRAGRRDQRRTLPGLLSPTASCTGTVARWEGTGRDGMEAAESPSGPVIAGSSLGGFKCSVSADGGAPSRGLRGSAHREGGAAERRRARPIRGQKRPSGGGAIVWKTAPLEDWGKKTEVSLKCVTKVKSLDIKWSLHIG